MLKWFILGLCTLSIPAAGAAAPDVIEELSDGCAGGSIRTSLLINRTMPEELIVANVLVACPRRTVGTFEDLLTIVRQARQGSSSNQGGAR